MKNQMTTKSIALLGVLIVMLLGVCYYKLVLGPVNDEISNLKSSIEAEQMEIDNNMTVVADINRMEKTISAAKSSGAAQVIPPYDNGQKLMNELYPILAKTSDYTLSFGDTRFEGYLAIFPASIDYACTSYSEARSIIDQICGGDSVMQIGDMAITMGEESRDGLVWTSLDINYFQVKS